VDESAVRLVPSFKLPGEGKARGNKGVRNMRRNVTTITALLLLAAAGCASPGQVEGPTALPRAVSTQVVARGTLLVTTVPATRIEEWDPERRGFSVFDAEGERVYKTNGFSAGRETLRLAPGRYVVVSLVGEGLTDRRLERRAALVAAGATTTVDFLAPVANQDTAP
jgi:hypothetical protein